jgi:membrane-bound serine protease (ClpP class)
MSAGSHSFGFLRRAAWLALLLGLALSLAAPLLGALADSGRPVVYYGAIDGEISPAMERYVSRAINQAGKDNAAAIVFRMDTPGGLSSAMDDIIQDILKSKVPVVVYVSPRGARAASAGVYITYAAHIAAMAPGTNIGSASPIFTDSSGNVTDGSATLNAKVTNDAVSQITNLANLRGRNADWAVQAVRNADNITADQAASMGVVDLLAPDLPTLLNDIDGRKVMLASGVATLNTANAEVRSIDMNVIEQFLQLLSNSTIAFLLLSAGMLGLFLEFSHPGAVFPGVAGGLSLLLGLFSLGQLPVNWAGVLLIGLAFVLFVADLYVASFGTLTIGGIVSFVLGSYLLISDNAPPGYQISRAAIWTMAACLLAFSLFLASAVMKARLKRPATGRQALIGTVGEVRRTLAPRGMIFTNGELWEAVSVTGEELLPGTQVVVTAIKGLQLMVRAANADEVTRSRRSMANAREVVPTSAKVTA